VPLAARAEPEDEIVSRFGQGDVDAGAGEGEFVRVARLVVLVRIVTEAEEPPCERPAVADARANAAPLLLQHAALGQVDVMQPALPEERVGLLSLLRERREQDPGTRAAAARGSRCR
jgi:hypothetical protein